MKSYPFHIYLNPEETKELLGIFKLLPPDSIKKLEELVLVLGEKDRSLATYLLRFLLGPTFRSLPQKKAVSLMHKYLAHLPFSVGVAFLQNLKNWLPQTEEQVAEMWAELGYRITRFDEKSGLWFFEKIFGLFKEAPIQQQKQILHCGLALTDISPKVGMAYLEGSPKVGELKIDPSGVWFEIGYHLGSKDPQLGETYFKTTPLFLAQGDLKELHWIAEGTLRLSGRHWCLGAAFLEASVEFIKYGDSSTWQRWIALTEELANKSVRTAREFWLSVGQVLKVISLAELELWFAAGCRLAEISEEVGVSFFKTSPEVLQTIEVLQINDWIELGLRESKQDVAVMTAFFSLQGKGSREKLMSLRKGLELDTVKPGLHTLAQGLFQQKISLRTIYDLPEQFHRYRRLCVTSDGQRLYVPDRINLFNSNEENFLLYKYMLIHQLGHQEAGTYQLIPQLPPWLRQRAGIKEEFDIPKNLVEFLALFEDSCILKKIFTMIEDGRVDRHISQQYPGLCIEWQYLLNLLRPTHPVSLETENLNCLAWLTQPIAGDPPWPAVSWDDKEMHYLQRMSAGKAAVEDSLILATIVYTKLNDREKQFVAEWPSLAYREELRPELLLVNEIAKNELDEVETSSQGLLTRDLPRLLPVLNKVGKLGEDIQFYRKLVERFKSFIEDEAEDLFREIRLYDEWDFSLGDYRPKWCQVREIVLKPSTARRVTVALERNYGLIESLKKYFAILRPDRFRKYRKQIDGEEIDLDAVIETLTEIRVGESQGQEGLYIRRDKRIRDVAAAFLLDLSDSTDEIVNDQGMTILDVEIEAVVIMAEALETIGDQYAIYGFSSNGRDKIDFYVLKDFAEEFNDVARQRFGGLRSANATRLGAAIRHAKTKLSQIEAAVKLLFVLSDGRPYDFDYYSPVEELDLKTWLKTDTDRYAQEDVRVALQELKMYGITPFALTVDRRGKEYLEHIFGQVNYLVMNQVEDLPIKLPEVYRRLTV